MTTSINGKVIGTTDLDPVNTNLDTIKSDILNAIANAGVPGEIKLVINPTGTAPAGTTKLENLAPEPTFNWLTAGEFRVGYLPKAFVVADAPNVKYVQALNANEDFITTTAGGGGSTAKRFLASNGYVPTTITLAGSASIGAANTYGLTDTGYLVYGSAVSSMTGFYSVAPSGSSSTIKLIASFTGYGSRGYSNVANMGSTLIIINGGTSNAPTVFSQLGTPGAWEFNPATNSATTLTAPPFRSAMGGSSNLIGPSTARVGNELFVLLTSYYSTDGATLIITAPQDAVPLYKLSADRVWSKIGDIPCPYVKSADNILTAYNPSNVKMFEAGGQLYVIGVVSNSWPAVHTIGMIKINPATGATSVVEIINQYPSSAASPCMSTGGPKALLHAVTTADGSKAYGATMLQGFPLQLANVVNAQPQTAFYVKKN